MTTDKVNIKTKMMLEEEVRLGRPLEEAIPEAYERLGTLEAAGKSLGIKPNTLYVWMLRLGITRRWILVRNRGQGRGAKQ